jgi:hypothetical protein
MGGMAIKSGFRQKEDEKRGGNKKKKYWKGWMGNWRKWEW